MVQRLQFIISKVKSLFGWRKWPHSQEKGLWDLNSSTSVGTFMLILLEKGSVCQNPKTSTSITGSILLALDLFSRRLSVS